MYRLGVCVLCVTLDTASGTWLGDRRCHWMMAEFSPSVGQSPTLSRSAPSNLRSVWHLGVIMQYMLRHPGPGGQLKQCRSMGGWHSWEEMKKYKKKRPAGIQQMTQSLALRSKEYSEAWDRWGISLTIYGDYMLEPFSLPLVYSTVPFFSLRRVQKKRPPEDFHSRMPAGTAAEW